MQIKQNGYSLIKGLHHVTSLASDANANNRFFTRELGLRRVKKTVNFDAPDIYHLYYGNTLGLPGTVITCFPFPFMSPGRPGAGEAGAVVFSVPEKALEFWKRRFARLGYRHVSERMVLGEKRLLFRGPDGDCLALVENGSDIREPWLADGIAPEIAIRGFHSVSLRLRDAGAMAELLRYAGYEETDKKDNWQRFHMAGGNGADIIDIETVGDMSPARMGVGSVHHIAFAVEDEEAQLLVREALLDAGYIVTPVIDRSYFSSVYFKTPDGIIFEIATNVPGFVRDEKAAHLGEALRLPKQHEHMREYLTTHLKPLED